MSDVSRRDVLRTAAIAAAAGPLALTAPAQAVPKALTQHEFQTLHVLSGLILPADKDSPGAMEVGAAAWIDLMASQNAELLAIFTGGLAWLDEAMRHRGHTDFLTAPAAAQTALLDLIAFRRNESPESGPGIRFFSWARRLVLDAWVTSPAGTRSLGYLGNTGVAEFVVPAASLNWAIEHSPA
ncbi:MAG TPA: gluconate 2-dehydrogenase subunit 3 family protein [Bryobacteraceae bacterium]|nr:gluconate 2-dehydrogenase subunit 3 family protein [Bryobacteraceae bacterium]